MVSRRSLLAATAAAGAAAFAGAAPARATDGDQVARELPSTLARSQAGGGGLAVAETEFPLTHLGVRWDGAPAQLRLRGADGWGPWRPLTADCPTGKDEEPFAVQTASAFVDAQHSTGYEVLSGGGGEVVVTELNTMDGPLRRADDPQSGMPLPGGHVAPVTYLSRAAWGANESYRFRPDGTEKWPVAAYPIQTINVHHQGQTLTGPDYGSAVRSLYRYLAIEKNNGDHTYHLYIDPNGVVYEGRHSGTDGVPLFQPGPDGRPLLANAGHTVGWNAGSLGICLLGNLAVVPPTAAAIDALTTVIAGISRVGGFAPPATTTYLNPVNAYTREIKRVSGHKDWGVVTDCPGGVYAHLKTIRTNAAGRLGTMFPEGVPFTS
ncbi:MAG: N-acetylmuramoyl-L-alanine amidase [Hamadaea sp.]|nr:N-acetylmuramoyl-L-alanine amidase [Hamadaea sp.]